MYSSTSGFYAKCCQASSTYKALHDIMDIVRTASVPPWMRSRPGQGTSIYISKLWCFCGLWSQTGKYLNHGVRCWFKNYFASATTLFETWVVITLIILWCMTMYLWTLCNMWHVCWIMYDLGCMLVINRDPWWYSTDYRVYMGSSMIVWLLCRLPLYLCSYKLDSSITFVILERLRHTTRDRWYACLEECFR